MLIKDWRSPRVGIPCGPARAVHLSRGGVMAWDGRDAPKVDGIGHSHGKVDEERARKREARIRRELAG